MSNGSRNGTLASDASLCTDLLQTFLVDDGAVRGRLVRLGPSLDTILGDHDYPIGVAKTMAETLALAAALAGALKFEGVFTLQIQSQGPLSLLVADVTSGGDMRAYARHDADRVTSGETPLLGTGFLALTVDQGPDTERYQGIVELVDADVERSAQRYFDQSEQLPTAFKLAVRPPSVDAAHLEEAHGWQAAALMVQRMPDNPETQGDGPDGENLGTAEADDAFRRAALLMATARDDELFDSHLPSQALLFPLFHAEGLILHEPQTLCARCRCSVERVARTLVSFPRPEIDELLDDAGDVVVTCEFCRTTYVFSGGDLDRLYAP